MENSRSIAQRWTTSVQLYPHSRPVLMANWLARGRLRERAALARVAWRAPDLRRRLEQMLVHACDREESAVFHLWGHSYELDHFDGWRALDDFLRFAADRVPRQSRKSVGDSIRAPRPAPPVRTGEHVGELQ